MAEWIRTVAESFPAKEGTGGNGADFAGADRTGRGELPPGVVADLVPFLAGLFLDVVKEGA